MRKIISKAATTRWEDPIYRQKQEGRTHNAELKRLDRERSLKLWKDPIYVAKYKKNFNPDVARDNLKKVRPKAIAVITSRLKEKWKDSAYKEKMSKMSETKWKDENYRNDVSNKLKEIYRDEERLVRYSLISKQRWMDPNYKERCITKIKESFTDSRRAAVSLQNKTNWKNTEFRNKIVALWDEPKRVWMSQINQLWWSDNKKREMSETMILRWMEPDFRRKSIEAFKNSWDDDRKKKAREWWTDERRKIASEKSKSLWQNPDYVKKVIDALLNEPSSLEVQFATMLDEMNVKYVWQKVIGPWSFDFMIGNSLVEVQGEYPHSLKETVIRDKQKATYIEQNHPNLKLLYLWEHEFYEIKRISEFINVNFLNKIDVVDFSFDEITFTPDCVEIKDAIIDLFNKYHYKGSVGRSGMMFGASCRNEIIAACVFAHPTRNVAGGELTRFIIHPNYQKKNFASWFLSRASKLALAKFGLLFTFADPNFNHDGTIYLASNWRFVGETTPDYWYSRDDGWVMHKKTLWNRAKNMVMTEAEYAEKHGYKKVWGLPKKKFVLSSRGIMLKVTM
ncbi:MAG: hypothetical protein Q8K86_09100 [Candidatus Nanopelagicaceae bacterium]|nr:hypothetical protein [Candidatus Nanopelagicaceae bacterium]